MNFAVNCHLTKQSTVSSVCHLSRDLMLFLGLWTTCLSLLLCMESLICKTNTCQLLKNYFFTVQYRQQPCNVPYYDPAIPLVKMSFTDQCIQCNILKQVLLVWKGIGKGYICHKKLRDTPTQIQKFEHSCARGINVLSLKISALIFEGIRNQTAFSCIFLTVTICNNAYKSDKSAITVKFCSCS